MRRPRSLFVYSTRNGNITALFDGARVRSKSCEIGTVLLGQFNAENSKQVRRSWPGDPEHRIAASIPRLKTHRARVGQYVTAQRYPRSTSGWNESIGGARH